MSILLIDPDRTLGTSIASHLIGEGDEVRVLVTDPTGWKERGVYVAVGDPMDPDLVERACTNVRTIVFTFTSRDVPVSLLAAVIPAARRAGTDRVIVCAPAPDRTTIGWLESSGTSFVALSTGRRGFLPKKTVEPSDIAEAVSAADDLTGEPRLLVDLTSEEEWSKLGGHA